MTDVVALTDIKRNLRLSESATTQDAHLTRLLDAAKRLVELETERTLAGTTPTLTGDDLAAANLAILLLVGTWYEDRGAEGSLPNAALWLLQPLRQFDDGGNAE